MNREIKKRKIKVFAKPRNLVDLKSAQYTVVQLAQWSMCCVQGPLQPGLLAQSQSYSI